MPKTKCTITTQQKKDICLYYQDHPCARYQDIALWASEKFQTLTPISKYTIETIIHRKDYFLRLKTDRSVRSSNRRIIEYLKKYLAKRYNRTGRMPSFERFDLAFRTYCNKKNYPVPPYGRVYYRSFTQQLLAKK